MKKSELKKYAKLIVSIGANVKKKQEVIINAPISASVLVEFIVEEAYKKGATRVSINWSNSAISKLNYKYQSTETLCEVFDYELSKQEHLSKVLPVMINIASPNPDAFKGIDTVKVAESSKAISLAFKPYQEIKEGKYQWTIAAFPNEDWAKKVFPSLPVKKGMKELWAAIAKCSRLEGNPIKNWNEHNTTLLSKKEILDNLKIKDLHLTSSNGTDFKVSLHENTHFIAGGLNNKKVYYNPNIPTEECFTSPNKNTANGVVYSSKPLLVRGGLVDNFGFKFKDGKVIEIITANDEDKTVLENLVNTDDGARMLGEVALVPFSSPVNQTNILFYNTLFDENASCHLALGESYCVNIKDGFSLSREELESKGANSSRTHVDFMFGSKCMSVVGITKDYKEVIVFENGNFVF